MASKNLIILSSVFTVLSIISLPIAQSVDPALMPCIQKILPCQPYLKSTSPPPATCCIPLKEVVANDKKCLCTVLNYSPLLHSLNITLDDALKLAKDCQTDADISVCKRILASPPGSTPEAPPPAPTGPVPSSKSGSTPAHRVTAFGGFIVFLVASIILFELS